MRVLQGSYKSTRRLLQESYKTLISLALLSYATQNSAVGTQLKTQTQHAVQNAGVRSQNEAPKRTPTRKTQGCPKPLQNAALQTSFLEIRLGPTSEPGGQIESATLLCKFQSADFKTRDFKMRDLMRVTRGWALLSLYDVHDVPFSGGYSKNYSGVKEATFFLS